MEISRRVHVVANRLPITVKPTQDGQFEFNISSGGLVSGLKGLSKSVPFKWFGWPGIEIHRNDKQTLKKELAEQFDAVPVFLSEEQASKHYNGFSNSVLWPLLHRLPEKARSDISWSGAYQEVNEIFADTIAPEVEDGDLIWIHDYHLLLLPTFLRKKLDERKKKNVKIGFFLHTPFPSEDYFSILPFREAICDGLLNCDVVGFHIEEYSRDFLDSASKVLEGVERSPSDLHYNGRKLIVHHFPIGIQPEEFTSSVGEEKIQVEITKLESSFQDKKILIGVDRLDYIKGIPQKLLAYDKFLSDHPEWSGKVVLIQLAIPSRSDVEEYKRLRQQVEELVGNINGKHGTYSWTPINYLYRSLSPDQLRALYAAADVCIIASIRDGLNMVSFEYVASQIEKKGTLMISQYIGAAKMLPSAITFNPWDTPRFAETIAKVLEMPTEEREERHDEALKVIEKWTSMNWGIRFLKTLDTMEVQAE